MVDSILPPRSTAPADSSEEKQFRTGVSLDRYSKLQAEGAQRGGMSVYQLVRAVVTLYVDKKLIPFDDLPIDLQKQVREFYESIPA